MKTQLQITALALATWLAAGAALAQTGNARVYQQGSDWVQEVTGTLPAAKLVKVTSSAGSIKVVGGPKSGITYTVREHFRAVTKEAALRELSHMQFRTSTSGETVALMAICEGDGRGHIDFEIQVPARTSALKLETQGGAVTAMNIAGKVEATTGGGDIHLDQVGGPITVASAGGQIDIGKVGGDAALSTGGGNIRVVEAAGHLVASSGGGNLNIGSARLMTLETGAGSIKVDKCQGQLKAQTGGGTIDLSEIGGAAMIESAGGGIKIGTVRGGLRAETASGPIYATLARGASFTDSRIETAMGDIIVYVPEGLGVTVKAMVETARGRGITTEFPELKVSQSGGMGPREAWAEGSINGGGPVLHVHTATGNIDFKRK
ncbi:MAG TPA: hypothetical protein VE783_03805 [Candidatus Limnocylindrales bacterium]|jgi:DUF4097 and DUF4098 domain-containing protein YvlB|nr:hypothetical protein [Candidatus Limnocylindrales bacterium]